MHFLAIEWADGELLEKYAKRQGPLPSDEVAAIVTQIADAVQAAHAVGIVHRDLKPENVMYDPATRQVKLLDFGIATDTDMAPEERLTRAGFFVGTLMYVAPEALSGELVGPAADQYSLATIAYFLLTGCLPFTAKTPREMFSQLLSQPPIPLNQARPGLRFSSAVEACDHARAEQGSEQALLRLGRVRRRSHARRSSSPLEEDDEEGLARANEVSLPKEVGARGRAQTAACCAVARRVRRLGRSRRLDSRAARS